jgi:hypothetical protein
MTDTAIITRATATGLSLIRYFTGQPCVRGHVAERRTSDGACITCRREVYAPASNAKRSCRKAESVRAVARNRTSRTVRRQAEFPTREIVTRPEAKKRGLRRYFTGLSCKRGHYSDRRMSNGVCLQCPQVRSKPEVIKKHKRLDYQRHKNAYFARAAARRAAKQYPPWADRKAIAVIIAACPPGSHVDHVVPLRGRFVSGLHVPWNLQYLPAAENLAKGNKWRT